MIERKISIIVAVSDNWAIGRRGDMPWHLSEDLKYFKRVTTGNTVIMGRKTWESIGCKPLPGRQNIVVSNTLEPTEDIRVVTSIMDAVKIAESQEIFIMGGGSIYAQSLKFVNNLYLTKVHKVVEDADTFFPELNLDEWRETFRSDDYYDEKFDVHFEFFRYEKKR